MTRRRPHVLPFVETCLLTLWLGAALFFAAAVAPAAFAVLPTSPHAGALVGRLLPTLFATGAVVGLSIVAIELRWRGEGTRLRTGAAAVMAVTCAVAQFGIGRRIEHLRRDTDRPIGLLAREDPRRVAFGRLHALSVAGLAAAMVAAAAAAAGSRVAPTAGR